MRANAHQEDKNNEFLYEDYIKNTIINIWQEALGIKEVRLEDDFFDLGGDSLAALQFIAEIKKKLNLELELVNIKYPTLQNIIEILSNQSKSGDKEKSNLILIKKRSMVTLLSLILVHPIGGDIYFYRDLASCLPEEQTVYAIRSPMLNGGKESKNIEQIAEEYLKLLKKNQIKPPYILGGSSYGGIIAYHMAHKF